jgi:hypothetical protein
MNETLKIVNPHGSRGLRVAVAEYPVPYEHTEEGREALAARAPDPVTLAQLNATTQAALDKAADSIIAEITGGTVPSGTMTDEELEAATAPQA